MESIKNEVNIEKKYEWFEMVKKDWDNYELKIGDVEWKFNCKNPQNFLNIVEITKKILNIYIKNEEDGKFYISTKQENYQIIKSLTLDDGILFDTNYLRSSWISKYIWDNNLQEYVKFINALVWTDFVKNWKNIDVNKIENWIKENYKSQVDWLFNKNSLILKKEFENTSFTMIYEKLINWYEPWLCQKIVNDLKNWKIEKDILSLVLLKILIKNEYKIKDLQDLRMWKKYSLNRELNHFKNLLSKDFKVTFFNEKYNPNVKTLKFKKEWNEIKIIWKTNDKKNVDVWVIKMPKFYADMI